jgi:hypothetical protein
MSDFSIVLELCDSRDQQSINIDNLFASILNFYIPIKLLKVNMVNLCLYGWNNNIQ